MKTKSSLTKLAMVISVLFLSTALLFSTAMAGNEKIQVTTEFGARVEKIRQSLPKTAADVVVGIETVVPKWQWIEVKNPDGIKSGNNDFKFGDTCGIDNGGIIQVVAKSGDRLLVKYFAKERAYGTKCPSGAVFFLTTEEFLKMGPQYFHLATTETQEKELVNKLLGIK